MSLNYQIIVPPSVEPVSLSQAKKQLRVDFPDDDLLILGYISAARELCEEKTNRAFYPQTIQYSLDSFPYGDFRSTIPIDQRSPWNFSAYWSDLAIRLPMPRTLSVQAINYLDANGIPQVLPTTAYYTDITSQPARIVPNAGATWPITQFYQPGSIQVVYQAGSYVQTITETLTVTGTGPYTAPLTYQNLGITSVLDTNGNPLAYTAPLTPDGNGDPTSQTQMTFAANPTNGQAVVTYQAGITPFTVIAAIGLILSHLYENREATIDTNLKEIPLGVDSLLRRQVFQNFGNFGSGY